MLHFIYNQDFPAVLSNCNKKNGKFVLHVPDSKLLGITQSYSDIELVQQCIER
jgi:hypothetical protein